MKVQLPESGEKGFIQRFQQIGGDDCVLVFPAHIGAKWNKSNLIFRSSIWRVSDLKPVSFGFKKFFNWLEQPDLAHTPFSVTANGGINCMEKMDGSLLIVSRYKGEWVIRTRGTFDAETLDNGAEIGILKNKYPSVFDTAEDTWDFSYLFEWVTPANRIVIDYSSVDIILLNKVWHEDYSLERQLELDEIANRLGVRRPQRYHFDSIGEMIDDVSSWEGKEGLCVYSKFDQEIRKIKGEWYLAAHRMKSELGSFERVLDFYLENDRPNYQDFYKTVEQVFDFEVAERIRGDISRCCDASKEVDALVGGMRTFVDRLLENASGDFKFRRKDMATKIFASYGKTNRASFLFKLLDGKDLEKSDYKKLFCQVMK